MKPFLRTGTSGNAQIQFIGKTRIIKKIGTAPGNLTLNTLEIQIQSGDNQDFCVSTPIHGVSVADIDKMIEQLKKAREFSVVSAEN